MEYLLLADINFGDFAVILANFAKIKLHAFNILGLR